MLLGSFQAGRPNPFRRRGLLPPAIKWLLIINVAAFAAQYLLGAAAPALYFPLFDTRAGLLPLQTNLDPQLTYVFGLFKPWQLVTYMFVHAGIWHILFNMFALWMFGVEIEERWRTQHFTTYYFICGVGGGVLQIALPLLISMTAAESGMMARNFAPLPVVGASGAVYGVLLAFGMMFPTRLVYIPLLFIPIGIPARMLVVIYAAISIVGGMSGGSNVAHFAHLGGMLFGYLYIKYQQRKRRFLRY